MKRTILSGLAISALLVGASVAYAADMPVKAAPMPEAAPVNSWSGFYFDVGAGWESQHFNWAWSNPVPATLAPFSFRASQAAFGAHIGYQQQFGWAVVGVEGGGLAGNSQWASVAGPGGVAGPCVGTNTCKASVGDVSTFGGKLGVAWQDWLVYGVGGAAWSGVQTQDVFATGTVVDTTANQSRKGYYVGGGVDFMAVKTRPIDLILGVEYQHVNLKSGLLTSSADGFSPAGDNGRNVGATEDVVLAKLTVKWNPLGM